MIAKLKGNLDTISYDGVILDVQGVGYHVNASSRTLAQLPDIGSPLTLFIEMLIRNEMPSLFGFLDSYEQAWFQKLITVQGVGAKVALAILSALTPDELSLAIHNQDKVQILRADGVGPKLAARLLTELKDKIVMSEIKMTTSSSSFPQDCSHVTSISDVLSALENLGYRRSETAPAVAKAIEQQGANADIAILIRTALGILSSKLTGAVL